MTTESDTRPCLHHSPVGGPVKLCQPGPVPAPSEGRRARPTPTPAVTPPPATSPPQPPSSGVLQSRSAREESSRIKEKNLCGHGAFSRQPRAPLHQPPVGSWTQSAQAGSRVPGGTHPEGRLVSAAPRVSASERPPPLGLLTLPCHPASPSCCDICPQEEGHARGLLTLVFQGLCGTPSSAGGQGRVLE